MEAIQATLQSADNILSVMYNNIYVSTAIKLFLGCYAFLAAPALPPFIASLFESTIFRILVISLVLLTRNYSPLVSLLVAVGFVISLQTLERYKAVSKIVDIASAQRQVAEKAEMPADEPEDADNKVDIAVKEIEQVNADTQGLTAPNTNVVGYEPIYGAEYGTQSSQL